MNDRVYELLPIGLLAWNVCVGTQKHVTKKVIKSCFFEKYIEIDITLYKPKKKTTVNIKIRHQNKQLCLLGD